MPEKRDLQEIWNILKLGRPLHRVPFIGPRCPFHHASHPGLLWWYLVADPGHPSHYREAMALYSNVSVGTGAELCHLDWCWSWNSSTLATSYKELTHWKRPWCWERLGAGGDRGWAGWMASLARWTWVWVNSRSWWWTGRPGVLRFMGSQRVRHDWATELNWTKLNI